MMSRRSDFRRSADGKRPWRPQPGDSGRGVSFRLTVLAGMFVLVLLLMFQSRKPENWRWMFAGRRAATGPAETTGAAARPELAQKPTADPDQLLETPEVKGPTQDSFTPPAASRPRDLFVNVDPSQLDSLADGRMLDDHDELLLKILYCLPRWGPALTERLERPAAPWRQVAEDLDSHRLQIFHVAGRVQQASRVALPPDQASLLEYDHYYRVRLELADAPFSAWIYARRVPDAWGMDRRLNQRASALALLLGNAAASGQTPQLLFATSRMAWSPEREEPEFGVGAGPALLGRLGMDIGLFDDVRGRNQKPMGAEDRECFYQLLAAAGRAPASEFRRSARGGFALAELLGDPASQLGRVGVLQATARRITEIPVDDPDIRTRLAIARYWQVDAFAPLVGAMVRLGRPDGGEEGPVFRNHFPVTLCCLRLPPDLARRAAVSGGEMDLNETVRLPCFFFRNWAYRSQYVSSFDEKQLQVSPMFVGSALQRVESAPSSWPRLGMAFGLAFVLVLACVWFGLWRYSLSDRKFDRGQLRGPSPNWNGLDPPRGPNPPGRADDDEPLGGGSA